MDKENAYSTKKNKKKINKSQLTTQKNSQNEVEEKLVITTKNELITKENDKQLSNRYKNLDILLSNKLQSLGNQENRQTSSNFIKKQNNLNMVNNLIKQKKTFPKQSFLKSLLNINHKEKSNDISDQSTSILVKKDKNHSKEQNSISYLNKKKKKYSSKNKHNIKITNSPKNIQKKLKVKINSDSISTPCLPKYNSSKHVKQRRLLSHQNLHKIIKNKNLLFFPNFEEKLYNSDFHDENHSQNKQKNKIKSKKEIKNVFKKRLSLSKYNYNNYPDIIRTTRSLNSPTSLKNISTQLKKGKYTSTLSFTPTSQSNINSNLKSEGNITPNNVMRTLFPEKKNIQLFQRKKKQKLTFSNCIKKYNNNLKINTKKKAKSRTSLTTNKIQGQNLHTFLLSNKPTGIEDANKIMSIITMDEVHKKIKETICQYDKKELIKEIHDLETNDICEAIEKLPIINNNLVNNDNKSNDNNEDRNNNNGSNKANYQDTKQFGILNNETSKTKLMLYFEKYRKLSHKELVYDSLDDEEIEEIEINFCYIKPNSITVYLIDSIILISSLIQLLYVPIFLAFNSKFCRNNFSINQLMFYLIDLFYILDLITEFLRAYYNFDEFLIKNKNKICKNYLKNWFVTDFIEAIPLYTIINMMENKCKINDIYFTNYYSKNINKLHYSLLLVKSLKIFKVIDKNKTLKKIKSKLNDYDLFFENKIVLFTIFIVFSSLNISSCLFIFVGRNSYPGWIINCNMQNDSFIYLYLNAVYYLMTSVTTVGYGDIFISSFTERIYQIIILIVGTCAYSYSVTYISNYIQKIQEKSMDLEKKLSILEEIKLSNENFNSELYDKIRRYLKYNRVEKKNNNEILINCLPYPLKNILFIEMYRDIIKNFKFFKSFENSNFIVKVVTSFKPVLIIKNDILVQEGDFIEDIIFVKEGVISLEICLDLDCVQESIEAYLNEKGFGKTTKLNSVKKNNKFETNLYSYKNSFNSTEFKFNEIPSNFSNEKEITDEIENKKYLRVLDIRKNEYYGDILMFLNERAPLRVKVKSKKAELFYLNKTDAIEISTLYPNIWKRIIQKSLFNMKQIKNLTRKILIYFAKLNGIILDEKLCKEISNLDSITPGSKFNDDSQTIDSAYRSQKSKNKKEENKNKNNIISSVIYEEENETLESALSDTILNHKITETTKRNFQNSIINNKKININYDVKENKNLQLKFKTDIEQILNENYIENLNDFDSKKTEKLFIYNNISKSSNCSETKKSNCRTASENVINSEIYPNEKFNDYKFLQSDNSESKKNSLVIDKEKNLEKKLIINDTNNDLNLNNKNEKKRENDNQSLKINDKKINYENLTIVNIMSTTISSVYENFNQITKNKFSRNINLRKRTIKFVIEESNKMSRNHSVASIFYPKNKMNNSLYLLQCLKNSPELFLKNKIKPKNSNSNEEHSFMMSISKKDFSEYKDIKPISPVEKNSFKFSKLDSTINHSLELNKSNVTKKNIELLKTSNFHNSVKTLYRKDTEKIFESVGKKSLKKKSMQNLSIASEDHELNFYGRMKTMRGNNNNNNIATINNNNELWKSPIKKSYLDIISHNILENKQTLNNPKEFYLDFFTNIVQKRISKRKKPNKNKKETNKRKTFEINKNKNRNRKFSSENNEEGKMKNKKTIKRPYSTKDILKKSIGLLS